ncbi:MAG: ATP-binding protein [Myxococcota bacterium]
MLTLCGGYMSSINAEGVVARALRAAGVERERLNGSNVTQVIEAMRPALRLFLNATHSSQLLAALEQLPAMSSGPTEQVIPLRSEADLVPCRQAARAACATVGLGPFALQKVATLVSELARNVVKYTPGGTLTIRANPTSRSVVVVAEDQGKGIPNLDEIFSGKYRSRTGLGLGLAGCRRLSQRFEVQTGPKGTRIEAEVNFDGRQ